jgi:glycosyltransferase involved in cell wall biosynthesis
MGLPQVLNENLSVEVPHAGGAGLPVNGKPMRPISILWLISGLEYGGAEMMLYKLLSRMDKTRFTVQVISMIDPGSFSGKIEELGVPLQSLGMRRGIPNPMGVVRLVRLLRQSRPDVIQTWMYHADLIGGLAAKLAGGIPVAWGIRQSNLSDHGSRRLTIYTMKMCARMSEWFPARIVCCSEASQRVHTALGYAPENMIVIPNGFDLSAFKPDPLARESVRAELGIPTDAPLIGLVGRFDRQKDHRNFVYAAALLHRSRPDVHLLLCGDDITWENTQLRGWIEEAGIRNRCALLGRRDDMSRLTAALDIATSSSSFGEGFPNVIGEAMACGVPCVVTDMGDCALIVGQTGRVVPPQNAKELANALSELVELGREGRSQLGAAARCRIIKYFNLPDIVARYENLYYEIAGAAQVS